MKQQEQTLRSQIKVLREQGLEDQVKKFQHELLLLTGVSEETESWLDMFITQDPQMISVKDIIRKLSKIHDEVLITGETGTGKEILARALHGNRAGPFIAINCAGLPEYLIESELFGHKKGAFTGADTDTAGLFKIAQDGTLFLDEIGELPLTLQAKLLRAVQFKTIRKVGGKIDEAISCRFISATHHNVLNLIENKLFRADLYYRISTFEVETTPLRERPDDVKLIASIKNPDYPVEDNGYPGNVRELERKIRRWEVLNL